MIVLDRIGKSFDGKWAVKELDLVVQKGEVFGLTSYIPMKMGERGLEGDLSV